SGTLTAAMGPVLGGAAAGVAGSVASQAFGVASGIQDQFSWKGVALAAIGGGVGGALQGVNAFGANATGLAKIGNDVVHGALGNAATQGIAVATKLQSKFDWAGVAVGGVVGGVTGTLGRALGVKPFSDNRSFANIANTTLSGAAGAIAGAGVRSIVEGTSFGDNVLAVLPDVIGNTIGNLTVSRLKGGSTTSRFAAAEGSNEAYVELARKDAARAGRRRGAGAAAINALISSEGFERTMLREKSIVMQAKAAGIDLRNGKDLLRFAEADAQTKSQALSASGPGEERVENGRATFGDRVAGTLIGAQQLYESIPENLRAGADFVLGALKGGPVGALASYVLDKVVVQGLSQTGADRTIGAAVTHLGQRGLAMIGGHSLESEQNQTNQSHASLFVAAGVTILGMASLGGPIKSGILGRGSVAAESAGSRFGGAYATNGELVQSVGTRADAWGIRQGLGNGRVAGTLKHGYAEDVLNRYQRMFGDRGLTAEARYVGGAPWESGMTTTGSIRLDVVEGPLLRPTGVWDYKFGNATLSQGRITQIQSGIPNGANVPILMVKP
ncbi:hypothetical protein, partial [uncultured Sphingomonas sp.]|uniref:hypothetical protein n=1 Tax=uncultured Sphingomonas sp. TaxID=158754 RepID=UPI0025FEB7B9